MYIMHVSMYPCTFVHILGNKIKTNLNEGHNAENQTEMKEEKKNIHS